MDMTSRSRFKRRMLLIMYEPPGASIQGETDPTGRGERIGIELGRPETCAPCRLDSVVPTAFG